VGQQSPDSPKTEDPSLVRQIVILNERVQKLTKALEALVPAPPKKESPMP
jgi:hypothetical protein